MRVPVADIFLSAALVAANNSTPCYNVTNGWNTTILNTTISNTTLDFNASISLHASCRTNLNSSYRATISFEKSVLASISRTWSGSTNTLSSPGLAPSMVVTRTEMSSLTRSELHSSYDRSVALSSSWVKSNSALTTTTLSSPGSASSVYGSYTKLSSLTGHKTQSSYELPARSNSTLTTTTLSSPESAASTYISHTNMTLLTSIKSQRSHELSVALSSPQVRLNSTIATSSRPVSSITTPNPSSLASSTVDKTLTPTLSGSSVQIISSTDRKVSPSFTATTGHSSITSIAVPSLGIKPYLSTVTTVRDDGDGIPPGVWAGLGIFLLSLAPLIKTWLTLPKPPSVPEIKWTCTGLKCIPLLPPPIPKPPDIIVNFPEIQPIIYAVEEIVPNLSELLYKFPMPPIGVVPCDGRMFRRRDAWDIDADETSSLEKRNLITDLIAAPFSLLSCAIKTSNQLKDEILKPVPQPDEVARLASALGEMKDAIDSLEEQAQAKASSHNGQSVGPETSALPANPLPGPGNFGFLSGHTGSFVTSVAMSTSSLGVRVSSTAPLTSRVTLSASVVPSSSRLSSMSLQPSSSSLQPSSWSSSSKPSPSSSAKPSSSSKASSSSSPKLSSSSSSNHTSSSSFSTSKVSSSPSLTVPSLKISSLSTESKSLPKTRSLSTTNSTRAMQISAHTTKMGSTSSFAPSSSVRPSSARSSSTRSSSARSPSTPVYSTPSPSTRPSATPSTRPSATPSSSSAHSPAAPKPSSSPPFNPPKPSPIQSVSSAKPSRAVSIILTQWRWQEGTSANPSTHKFGSWNSWTFFETKIGKEANGCRKPDHENKHTKWIEADAIARPPWPHGEMDMVLYDKNCRYKNDGRGAGVLTCRGMAEGTVVRCKAHAEKDAWDKDKGPPTTQCYTNLHSSRTFHRVGRCEW